jgi:hypothetical protein
MVLENMYIEATPKTPHVDFNQLTGDLILSGRSIPENAPRIYEPIYNWINEYTQHPKQTTNLRFNLEYFNSASSIWLAKITKALSRINNPDNILFIHLYLSIEDFDNMDNEDLKDELNHMIDIINSATISVGIKIHGTDDKGEVVKESIVLV